MNKLIEPFVLLDDCSKDVTGSQSLLFDNAKEVITADNHETLSAALKRIDELVDAGYYVSGWVAYEVASFFEKRLGETLKRKPKGPLIWMIATDKPRELSKDEVSQLLDERSGSSMTVVPSDDIPSFEHYKSKVDQVQNYISAGDVYQINYTFTQPFKIDGCAIKLYEAMRKNQPVHYGAFIRTGGIDVLSMSPELFVQSKQGVLTARPMKGTAPRGKDDISDAAIAQSMLSDEKSRAENLMIVDLLRNDLSRIADSGSVKVPALFELEKYKTLFQMTSTIEASLSRPIKPSDLLKALFPCGSVTGAPKIRAMEIIDELEGESRGVYCGAIGYFAPCGDFTLSVPIRTATLNHSGKGSMGIGSGIVSDSRAEAEYEECLLKAQFLTELNPDCDLIETFKWTPEAGFIRLSQHLQRLTKSAAAFYRPMDTSAIQYMLQSYVKDKTAPQRVRLELARSGSFEINMTEIPNSTPKELQTICLAGPSVEALDPLLRHKTSRRDIFDNVRREAVAQHGVTDVIFVNERAEITQGAISNIFVEIDGVLVTPPLECGLLPGVMRQTILDGPQKTSQKLLYLDDLRSAPNIYICNSLRGIIPVSLIKVEPVFAG